jgi:hypothetical protein
MEHFCMPQFGQVYPDRDAYRKPWREWPREIPDSFVRKFGFDLEKGSSEIEVA